MDKKIKTQLEDLGTRAVFKRIAVTKEQIKQYHLEQFTNPDPEIIKRFKNPKNRHVKPFIQEFGSAFQIELEALDALPDFKDIVRKEVEKLFDQKIRKKVLNRPEHSQEPEVINTRL